MWKRFELIKARVDYSGSTVDPGVTTPGTTRCGHCRHRLGHTANDCPLHSYKANHASALLKEVSGKAKAKSLTDKFKALVAPSNTDDEITAAIVAARAEVLGSG